MSRLRALRLLPLLLAAVVAGGAAGAVEARPVATAPNDAAMEKLERIIRARVDSSRTTGIAAGMVFPDGETRVFAYGSAGGGKRLTADPNSATPIRGRLSAIAMSSRTSNESSPGVSGRSPCAPRGAHRLRARP